MRNKKDYEAASFAPDFFLVGAARCGTTALHSWLKRHPQIRMTDPDKEPGYYCDFWGTEKFSDYSRNFEGAREEQLRGDASTHYMTAPNTPAILRKANPEARIIINLRNPVERAFSLFRFMKSQGYENIKDFDEALAAEANRSERLLGPMSEATTYPYNFLYFRTGCYYEQLQRYFDTFPKEQILVIIFEEMIKDPMTAHANILEHLGLPPESPDSSLPRENGAWEPRSLTFQKFLKQRINPLCKTLRLPHHRIYAKLSRWNRDDSATPAINPATRKRLIKAYRSDIEQSEKLLGRSLDIWQTF